MKPTIRWTPELAEELLAERARTGHSWAAIGARRGWTRAQTIGGVWRHITRGLPAGARAPRTGRAPRTPSIYVHIDPETRDELRARAKKEKTSMSALIRDYIEWGLMQ